MEAVEIYRNFYEKVKEFNTAMGQAVDKPMTYDLAKLRLNLIDEEMRELEVECSYASKDIDEEGEVSRSTIMNLIKELADLEYVAAGFNVAFGIPLNPYTNIDYDFGKSRKYGFTKENINSGMRDVKVAVNVVHEVVKKYLYEQEYGDSKHTSEYWESALSSASVNLTMAVVFFAICNNIDLPEVFDEVHKSNMSKLGDDGKPIYRKDGKVIKGPNYKKPNLERFV